MYFKNAKDVVNNVTTWKDASTEPNVDPHFFTDVNGEDILWEPGVVSFAQFQVANVGNLALKYVLQAFASDFNVVTNTDYKLLDVIQFAVVDGTTTYASRDEVAGLDFKDWAEFTAAGSLLPNETDEFTVVAYWEPGDSDNNWNVNNGKTVTPEYVIDGEQTLYVDIDVRLKATQLTSEEDSFDALYDFDATFDDGSTVPSSGSDSKEIATDTDVSVATKLETPIATVEIPSGAINAGAEGGSVELNIKPANSLPAGLIVSSTQEAMPYDISLEKTGTVSIAEGTIFDATIYVGIGRTGVKIYHYSNALNDVGSAEALAAVTALTGANANGAFYYDVDSGWAHLKVNSFSPYTVLYTPANTGYFSGGNGSTLYPYLMSTEQDMLDFLHYSMVMYGQVAAEADKADLYEMLFYRACYKMTNDITVTTPVRNFGGSQCLFDGNGHTLTATFTSESELGLGNTVGFLYGFNGSSSAYIYEATTEAERNSDYAYTINGKTYMLTAGTIRDLTIKGSVYSNLSCAASVVGGQNTGYIINVTNYANITVNAPAYFVGGITGYTKGTGLVMDCKNYGTITCTGNTSPVGGISGQLYGGSSGNYPDIGDPYSASVLNCENHGAISAPDAGDVGGIVGQTHGYDAGYKKAIVNCKNTANVTGGTNVGGIIGRNPSSGVTICLLNNTNSGTVNGTNTGDIIGVNQGYLVISAKNLNEINSALGKASNITIELLDDIALGDNDVITISDASKVTINGNSHKISFTNKSVFNKKYGLKGTIELTVNNVVFEKVGTQAGYAVLSGSAFSGKVTLDQCSFINCKYGVYMDANGSEKATLSITNSTYDNTLWGYAYDNSNAEKKPYNVDVTFTGNTGIAEDHICESFAK